MSDTTRARYECPVCGLVEYCDEHLRAGFPPEATESAARRRHGKCPGELRYSAGVQPRGRMTGQTQTGEQG